MSIKVTSYRYIKPGIDLTSVANSSDGQFLAVLRQLPTG
jgi:hypothetical protein